MPGTTFTWTPDFGARAAYKPRVRTAKFGDGYEQRVADGINTAMDRWQLTFAVRDDLEANDILAFLAARGGFEAFNWTPPGETLPISVVCREWNRTFDRHDQNTVTATFERVYEP
jgi:phage-related protein